MEATYSESEGRRPVRATSNDDIFEAVRLSLHRVIAAIETTKLSSKMIY